MKRILTILGVVALAAIPVLAGGGDHSGCCMKQAGVERTVTNIDNGVRITLAASDPQVVSTLQGKVEGCGKDGCGDCPMHAEGVTRTVEKTDNGVVITATASDASVVAKLQQHATAMGAGGCGKKAADKPAGCPHHKAGEPAKS